ncbi:hypothetical protein GGI12_005867 [Dipsacomyces acuminosporus]|nr:hypothetical protein GGI12_005867 [Dipsacomyces acuminosporus]
MVFLRNNKSPAPTYIKRLYFIVPAAVGLVHSMPQYIWAALQGYCTASDPMARGTKEYQVYVVFALLFLPWLFMLFNVVICTWAITWLVIKQRQMNWSLEYIRNRRELILQSSQQFTAISKYDLAMIDEYERQLKVRSKINSSAFRIALYPLAPLVWCIIMTVHTAMLFGVTMTYESDIETLAKAQKLAWLSYPATTLLNFLVFLSDPVMLDVIGEVRESVMAKCSSKSDFAEIESQQGCDANSDMPLDEPTVTDQEYSSEKQSTQPGAAGVQYRRNVRNSMYQVIDSARRRDNVYNEAILAEI